jgi:rhamnosyltransferase
MYDPENKVGVLVLTLNAAQHLRRCLEPVLQSSLRPKVLVIDSSSTDGTRDIAARLGVQVMKIKPNEFNHGATREQGRKLLNTEVVVMMTQDAYPVNPAMLEYLIQPILSGQSSVSYARQLPHQHADLVESFQREYNYPSESQIRGLDDIKKYGVYTFFCSNSCAAWSNPALDQLGGFPAVLSNEDYITVARLLSRGQRIAYVAEAQVYHSHTYTLRQEFQRYFDIGYVRAEHRWIRELAGKDESRGFTFSTALIKRAFMKKIWLLPGIFALLAAKWLGYRLGFYARRLPVKNFKWASSQKYYWQSGYAHSNLIGKIKPHENI